MSEEVTIGEAIRARLISQSDVTDLVGTRIYSLIRPSGTALPAITYQGVGESRPRGMVKEPGELVSARLQFNCRAAANAGGYLSSRRLAREVIDALEDYSGVSAGMTIQSIEIVNQMDRHESGGGTGDVFLTIVEVRVWHEE